MTSIRIITYIDSARLDCTRSHAICHLRLALASPTLPRDCQCRANIQHEDMQQECIEHMSKACISLPQKISTEVRYVCSLSSKRPNMFFL